MPIKFSIALPAMATITRPANVSLMPNVFMAGCNASTNQSETNAAATPAQPSTINVSGKDHLAFSASCSGTSVLSPFTEK